MCAAGRAGVGTSQAFWGPADYVKVPHAGHGAAGFGFTLVWSFICYVPLLLLWNKDVYLCYILEVCNVFLIL